ncbi:MAG: PEP-CTERM sorting domain-containing protein [Phycisphaerales bacterium]|nr:PEP-CTERM sorting domain-containing protein [Phycisphaerales bacterium]MCB9864638.1 PEP-CTERM sorting domain-containing protein [Phycisphaerales bacterium]
MKRLVQIEICIWGLLSFAAPTAHAAFDFSFFRLITITQDSSGPTVISDYENISTPDNEIHTLLDTGIGTGYARTQYDVSWLGYTGIFNAAVDQHIAEPEFLTTAEVRIEFFADVDLLLTVDTELEFSSSPMDWADFRYQIFVRDLTVFWPPHYVANHRGGALTLEPASGTFVTHDSVLLPAGTSYRIIHSLSQDSISVDSPQHAPIDVSGYMNFSLTPVPEPSTALLFAGAASAALVRRRRRDCRSSFHGAPIPPTCC